MPVELVFILERWVAMAEADVSLRDRQPWKAAYERDYAFLAGAIDKHYAGDDTDVKILLGGVVAAFAGMDVEAYGSHAASFVRDSAHPTLRRPFSGVGFQPMVELLRYLEASGFTTFIASGGSRDFMRGFAWDVYGIPPERIIGSSNQLTWSDEGDGTLVYAAAPDVFDDGPAKPDPHLEPDRSAPAHRRRQFEWRSPDADVRRDERSTPVAPARPARRPRTGIRLRQGGGEGPGCRGRPGVDRHQCEERLVDGLRRPVR